MGRTATKTRRPKIADLPPVLTLPQVAAFFGNSPHWCHDNLDREACRIDVGGGKALKVWRRGRVWRAWRADLADLFPEAQ